MEEAGELVDATEDGKAQVVHETADLLFHVLVLLASLDVKYATILDELTKRFGTSGIEEKNNKNPFDNIKEKKYNKDKKEGKTMTGKPETKVEVEPEVNEKKK